MDQETKDSIKRLTITGALAVTFTTAGAAGAYYLTKAVDKDNKPSTACMIWGGILGCVKAVKKHGKVYGSSEPDAPKNTLN